MSQEEEYVYLKCVKDKSKLRVRIISDGYLKYANCQFPRDLRQVDRVYKVRRRAINLIRTRGTYFYSVKSKNDIEIITEFDEKSCEIDFSKLTVYEDETQEECLICYCNKKSVVFFPCGHFYTCGDCSKKIEKCPICREKITSSINKEEMG